MKKPGNMYKEIDKCRICGNPELLPIVDLGSQVLTGVFPKSKDQMITSGPLELVKCREDEEGRHCGLVQLRHSYELAEMYGENYGYRSGLNQSMVRHLNEKVKKILQLISLGKNDLIIDIGSNDATLLRAYPDKGLMLAGIDPTGSKFREFYPERVRLIPDFFSAEVVRKEFGRKKAKVVTSISMFYDLEAPLDFMRQVHEILDDDGLWVLEQSYMPTMLAMNSYDTICHEHLEYYRLKQIQWMAQKVGLKIIDVEFNGINGGSFSVTVAKKNAVHRENRELTDRIFNEEKTMGLGTPAPYKEFQRRILALREELKRFMNRENTEGKKVFGYGASTKGNVLLQYCNFTDKDLPYIAEVNKDKYGAFTPGTLIPIISEEEAKALKPDAFLVMPWHFKDNIVKKEKAYLAGGGKLIFPLPNIEVV